jgi:hypothetical protein
MTSSQQSQDISKLRRIAGKARRLAAALSRGEAHRLHRRADALEEEAHRLEQAADAMQANEKPAAE